MPPIHRSSFDVRFDECDAYGLINNPNLLRYMYEAGLRAERTLGLPVPSSDGTSPIRAAAHVEVAFMSPVHYPDTLDVSTWISAVHSDGWERRYEIRRAGEDPVLAECRTEWRMAAPLGGMPLELSDEIRRPLEAASGPAAGSSWTATPSNSSPAPAGALHRRRQVAWRDVDPQEVLSLPAIVDYMTDAGIEAGAAHGWTLARCESEGLAFVVREHVIDYLRLASLGDLLDVSTWLSGVRRSTGLRHYELRCEADENVVAKGHTRWVVVRPESMRPTRLPDLFETDFKGHISG
jgi:acyl-CoA thioester hydrolase